MCIRSVVLGLFVLLSFSVRASEGADAEEFRPGEMINHHIKDSHGWEIAHGIELPLPVIVYSEANGLDVFLSHNFHHGDSGPAQYKDYMLEHGEIHLTTGAHVWDFSITKNVFFLFLTVGLMLMVFLSIAKSYQKNQHVAPKGLQSLFEPIILFVRDEVVKPNIGPKYERYLPYMLTLFFFIWFGNLLGLLPAAANLTGNIAVTAVLAVLTMIITNLSANRSYWTHIFNTPGVPWWLKFPIPVMPVVEFIGIFTKPFSLLLRLFVAITAGHIVILSLLGLIFIFQSYAVGVASTLVVTVITFIEILVATIQAYVFTMFSSLYIGMAIQDEHH